MSRASHTREGARFMERVIQPFGPPGAVALGRALTNAPAGPPPKGAGDYLRALKRRLWLVVLVALGVILPGSAYVLRRPNIYRVFSSIRIEPPVFDERVATIVPHAGVGQTSREAAEKYVPNQISDLRSRWLAEEVVADPELNIPPEAIESVVNDLVTGLTTRRHPDSNNFDVYLEGQDPARITALLNALLERFAERARDDSLRVLRASERKASDSLASLSKDLATLDQTILRMVQENPSFGPDGRSLLQDRYVQVNSILTQKRLRHDDLRHEQMLGQFGTGQLLQARPRPYQQRIESLLEMKERLTEELEYHRRIVRNFETDPAPRYVARRLNKVLDELEKLQRLDVQPEADLGSMILAHSGEEILKLEKEVQGLINEMQAAMPEYTRYVALLREREQKEQSMRTMRERLDEFKLLSGTLTDPVRINQRALEPTVPIRPNRPLYLVLVVLLGLGLGVGLVCALESFDRRVKVPEHLTDGLRLPLLGVIPRMRRLAELHRGGHLWSPGAPRSAEADAFRNLRASLIGPVGSEGQPLVTILVTSAKAGEGKSTTALNLAATFARAGERTLLMDMDLRRPSLAEVFEPDSELGLVDVLRGDMPWPRAVVRTDVPNLDFLPTGDPEGVPIEVLGTLEVRQLIEAVSGHYHRVILDAPAVLGLADCRMLGQLVDGAVLVVRCGAHDLSPLRRAKEMLEQSRVPLSGVVFNDLDDDLANWSSHHALPSGASPRGAARALEGDVAPLSAPAASPGA
jgi:succinoglycan biosynthesis transport protein ExoP